MINKLIEALENSVKVDLLEIKKQTYQLDYYLLEQELLCMNLLLLFFKYPPKPDQSEKILALVRSGKLIHNLRADLTSRALPFISYLLALSCLNVNGQKPEEFKFSNEKWLDLKTYENPSTRQISDIDALQAMTACLVGLKTCSS